MKTFCYIIKEVTKHLGLFTVDKELTEERYKRFAELAILYGYARKYAKTHCIQESQRIETFLVEQMKMISTDRIFKNYYVSYHLILPYISIRSFYKIDHLERCLEIIIKNKMLSSEIPPHRQMEWNHMMFKMGLLEEMTIPRSSILNKTMYLQFLSRELTYAITHALFYVTDFGFEKEMCQIPNSEKLPFVLGTLIAKAAEEKDIDLLLELTINYVSLNKQATVDFDLLKVVLNTLNDTNFIAFNLDEEQMVKKYHTLFVLNILCMQLHELTTKEKLLNKSQKVVVNKIINFSETKNQKEEVLEHKYLDAWEIMKSFKGKIFEFSKVRRYYKNWGFCENLSSETMQHINHLQERAKKGIVWEKESEKLNLKPKQQLKLNNQLVELLIKEKKQLAK